jgi:starch phosphorylase
MSDESRRDRNPALAVLPTDIEGFDRLRELALDVRWSWNHAADTIWKRLDTELWELTHSPWGILQSVARDRIERLMQDPTFFEEVDALLEARRSEEAAPAWFQRQYPTGSISHIAYFSMEFMLSEALPIYSGGLGNVAGDQLKAAGDLGVPVVGVGLLYQQGYFRQVIDRDGLQQAVFPYNDPGQLPISPVRRANGEWLRFQLNLPGYPIWVRTWQVRVGRCRLYLLDSNDPANYPIYRGITSELYGGNQELRLQQELLLGIGGWRLLGWLGIKPEVCHLNEGHAAFAILERSAAYQQQSGQTFDVALTTTRAGNLFTSHTAVAAGFDAFEPALIERYLGQYATSQLGITPRELLALGRRNPEDDSELFNMAQLALRGAGSVNGVSRLHGAVSRGLFAGSFPRWPVNEVPIGHVTNGVHVPSWDSAAADALWTRTYGPGHWRNPDGSPAREIENLSDIELWNLRNASRAELIDYARARLVRQLQISGGDVHDVEFIQPLLNPGVLTIGFARRFAAYKRPNLLLQDPERLLRLLTDAHRPVQLILAGKAHPADLLGQQLIAQWTQFIRRSRARQHVIFLADYDMLLTERLVQGVDLWLNTPRRPWEACGTSGMKTLVNGGLNLSELDGWWEEAYTPEVGWALGDRGSPAKSFTSDATEANMLYTLLEREVVPQFYERDLQGIPSAWVARMRQSMGRLTPQYSSARTVREYVEQHYVPCAARYCERESDGGQGGRQLAEWMAAVRRHWSAVIFESVHFITEGDTHHAQIRLQLGGLDPDSVQVQLYADAAGDHATEQHVATPARSLFDPTGTYLYEADIPAARSSSDYTARVLPHRQGVSVPLELDCILWQR